MSEGGWLDTLRYVLALVLWVSLPAAVVFWLVIHPFAAFWRRLGPVASYSIAGLAMAAVGYGAWLLREPALAVRFGFHPALAMLGLAVYVLAVVIERRCRRHLKLKILVGMPEVSKRSPSVLLTEGIYAHTRNPRYLDIMIGVAGWSLIVNYPTVYWLTLGVVAGLYGVTLLEERELRERFGEPYEVYCRAVPRFVPRSWAFLKA